MVCESVTEESKYNERPIDYQAILTKYLCLVISTAGHSLLDSADEDYISIPEMSVLRGIEQEIEDGIIR